MKERNANFDLMKIISMLMIIGGHLLLHGKILYNTQGILNYFLNLLMFIFIVHVNSYVLTTGYFQYKKEFKLSKIVSLNNAMWFYKVIIMLIFLVLNLVVLSKIDIMKIILPLNYNDYWFIRCYLLLYLCTPLLNIIIKNTTRKQHKTILIFMFIILSIISTITNQEVIYNLNGYSTQNFIFLYFIGAYLSKYKIEMTKNKNKQRFISIICILIIVLIQSIIYIIINKYSYMVKDEIILRFINTIKNSNLSYCNPIIIIQSVLYFMFFKTFNIKSKIITKISTMSFGIYLIHDNNLIRNYMYTNILKLPIETVYDYKIFPKFMIYIIIIFISCAIIEFIRKSIFKIIYDMKISKRIRNKIKAFFAKKDIYW